jgi:hydrogenase maturation factor
MGGIPKWFLATILLPENHTTSKLAENIFHQLSSACKEIDVAFCGGHTEITIGIDRPIVIGMMLGEVEKDGLITTAGARVGDDIILTKAIAIEATSIIARKKRRTHWYIWRRCRYLQKFTKNDISILRKPNSRTGAEKFIQCMIQLRRSGHRTL